MGGTKLQRFHEQEAEMFDRAAEFRKAMSPAIDKNRFKSMTNLQKREAFKESIKGTVFDSIGDNGVSTAVVAANAMIAYEKTHGEKPSDEILSGGISTMTNMLAQGVSGDNRVHQIMDSATGSMKNSEGIIKRNHQIAIIFPSAFTTITNDFTTWIPPNHDKSEIFVVNTIAGSDFGDRKRGDFINESFSGQYSTLDQYHLISLGDGVTKDFEFDISKFGAKKAMPIREGYIEIYHDRNKVAGDKDGVISGVFDNDTIVTNNNGIPNYTEGKFGFSFSKAPAQGIEISVRVDISIEHAPGLIPVIDHKMKSFTVRPHESALQYSLTIQSAHAMRREFDVNLQSVHMTRSRNVQSKEKDNKRLRDMYRAAHSFIEFNVKPRSGISNVDHYDSLSEFFGHVSMVQVSTNKKSGTTHMVFGLNSANIIKSTRQFVKPAGYIQLPQAHYIGTYNGIKCYEDPNMIEIKADGTAENTPNDVLCIAKGASRGDSAYLAADAISAIPFSHALLSGNQSSESGMRHEETLYELAYRVINPNDGRKYLQRVRFINE